MVSEQAEIETKCSVCCALHDKTDFGRYADMGPQWCTRCCKNLEKHHNQFEEFMLNEPLPICELFQ